MPVTFLTDEDEKKFVKTVNGIAPDENGNVQIPVSGGNANLSGTEKNLILTLFHNAAYISDGMSAVLTQLESLWSGGGEVEPDEPDTEKTLTSISATYSGGEVAVGTAVSKLTGIVVTAHYSDDTSETVTGYTMSGEIVEGSNTITVTYGGKNATFTVTGVAEESDLAQYAYTIAGSGNLNESGGLMGGPYNYTDFIEVDSGYDGATIAVYLATAAPGNTWVYSFVQWFNEDTFLERTSTSIMVYDGNTKEVIHFTAPEGATKFRISVQNNCERFALFKGTVTADQI